jgi:hypothetical protein
MASETVANSSTAAGGLTPAQQLMEQHDHHATVEEVVDEEDVAHPPPSAAAKTVTTDGPASGLSDKATGKQKVDDATAPAKKPAKAPLNMASEEAFPALGPAKPRAAPSFTPTWGKKPSMAGSNGVNGNAVTPSNGTSRASTPASSISPHPVSVSRGAALPTMSLPGRYQQSISFAPTQLIPRKELKKPLNDIIRDINKRSKAKLEHKAGPNNKIIFEATGPPDAVRQALMDIANEIGSKVSKAQQHALQED